MGSDIFPSWHYLWSAYNAVWYCILFLSRKLSQVRYFLTLLNTAPGEDRMAIPQEHSLFAQSPHFDTIYKLGFVQLLLKIAGGASLKLKTLSPKRIIL
jgi:hypothetical protein